MARGTEQLKLGKLDQAQRSFRIALDNDPENVRVLALLGLTYFRGNQFAEARPIYEHLVEKAPTDASHRMNLGLVFLKLNEADKAISSLEASRALDPSVNNTVTYLGLAYARSGRYAEAYRSFLLAGRNDFASEIEINLTQAEREGIQNQLGRGPSAPVAAVAAEPRAKPPSAPPRTARVAGQDFAGPQLSNPEIVITRTADDAPSVPMVPARSGASIVEPPKEPPPPTASPVEAARLTDSMQFVLPPTTEAAPQPITGASMISRAVAAAAPTNSTLPGERTKAGGIPPRPLHDLAIDDLIRPEDGDDAFEISTSGELVIRISDRVMTRLEGVHITGGDLSYEVATRRSRGSQTEERFDYGGTPLHAVSGTGYLIAVPGKHTFSALMLDDDILYLREDLVFAFETTLRWESGNVPGLRGKLPVVQFRGDGALAVKLVRPLVRVKLPASGVIFVDAERLAGWIGRVIPRAVVPPSGGPMGMMCVECTGEGIVLVEPKGELPPAVIAAAAPSPAPESARERATPPPPPPGPAEIDPDLDMSSVTEGMNDDPLPGEQPPADKPDDTPAADTSDES